MFHALSMTNNQEYQNIPTIWPTDLSLVREMAGLPRKIGAILQTIEALEACSRVCFKLRIEVVVTHGTIIVLGMLEMLVILAIYDLVCPPKLGILEMTKTA
jgi:hypothetical protein